jgi:hypothetical protein
MNNPFIKLTHFVSKQPVFLSTRHIVSIEEGGEEGNSRVTTCLNFSYYTVEAPFEIMSIIDLYNQSQPYHLKHERR